MTDLSLPIRPKLIFERATMINNIVSSLSLPAGKDKYEVSVKGVTGLRVVINKSGWISFLYRYTLQKKKGAIAIGNYPEFTAIQVAEICSHFEQLLHMGIDPRAERQKQQAMPILKTFFQEVYLPFAQENKKSWQDDISRFRLHIHPVLGDIVLDKITSSQIIQCLQEMKSKKLSNASANRVRSLISSILHKACDHELIEHNPMLRVKKYKEQNHIDRSLSDEELARLLAVLIDPLTYGISNMIIIKIIQTLLLTGMRKSEVLKLRWSDMDFSYKLLKLDDNKSGKPRTIPLNSEALQVIGSIPRQFDYIFANPATAQPYQDIRKTFNAVLKAANIQNFRIHDLRHNFASMAVNSGLGIYMVQHLLGHSSPITTQRYAHLRQDTLRDASEHIVKFMKPSEDQD